MVLKFTKLESLDYADVGSADDQTDQTKQTDKVILKKVDELKKQIKDFRWKVNFKLQRDKMFKIQSQLVKRMNQRKVSKGLLLKNNDLLANFNSRIKEIRETLDLYKEKVDNQIF